MFSIAWRVVADPLDGYEAARRLAGLLADIIGMTSVEKVEIYTKFENCWSVDLYTPLDTTSFNSAVISMLHLSSRLSSPWLENFDPEDREFSLIFNRSDHSRYMDEKLQSIRWISADLIKD